MTHCNHSTDYILRQYTEAECSIVSTICKEHQCFFVQQATSCGSHDGLIPYIDFMYCGFGPSGLPGTSTILVLWLGVLFIGLGVTADDFLCPSLAVISKTLRLSQNLAGVTFLAFGNGAPDVFSSIAGIGQDRSDLVIGELFGAGVFVTTVVVGTICLTQNFKIMERPFLRDIIFYIAASYWAFCLFYYRRITLGHSIGFIGLYSSYILVVVVSRLIYQKHMQDKKKCKGSPSVTAASASSIPTITIEAVSDSSLALPNGKSKREHSPENILDDPESLPPPYNAVVHQGISFQSGTCNSIADDDPEAEGIVLRRITFKTGSFSHRSMRRRTISTQSEQSTHQQSGIYYISSSSTEEGKSSPGITYTTEPPPFTSQQSTFSINTIDSTAALTPPVATVSEAFTDGLKDLLYAICPINLSEWSDMRWYGRIFEVVKAPVRFVVLITTPVVDYELERENWCKLHNVILTVTAPMFMCLASQYYMFLIGKTVPVWAMVFGISCLCAVLVFCTSKYSEPPKYHFLYGYLGFLVSVMWIYRMAQEIVNLLQAFGVAFGISDAILGLTVLAWGNSIGDFVTNVSIAKQGYPRMAISACYGSPLLNLLLGIGIPYTIALIQKTDVGSALVLNYTNMVTVLYSFLTISLCSTLVIMTALWFKTRKWNGVSLLLLYVTFLTVAILTEVNVI